MAVAMAERYDSPYDTVDLVHAINFILSQFLFERLVEDGRQQSLTKQG